MYTIAFVGPSEEDLAAMVVAIVAIAVLLRWLRRHFKWRIVLGFFGVLLIVQLTASTVPNSDPDTDTTSPPTGVYIADTGVFAERPGGRNDPPGESRNCRRRIDATILADDQITLLVPEAVRDELSNGSSATRQLARMESARARVLPVSDGDLTGIPVATLRSRRFTDNDMKILQAAKEHGVPVLAANARLKTQARTYGREKYWRSVYVLVVCQALP